jgi:hypothetical protein
MIPRIIASAGVLCFVVGCATDPWTVVPHAQGESILVNRQTGETWLFLKTTGPGDGIRAEWISIPHAAKKGDNK